MSCHYWLKGCLLTRVRIYLQTVLALDIFEAICAPDEIAVVIVDHSTIHSARPKDALLVERINLRDEDLDNPPKPRAPKAPKPGARPGAQPKPSKPKQPVERLRDGWYRDPRTGEMTVQPMYLANGARKGGLTILTVCVHIRKFAGQLGFCCAVFVMVYF